MAQHLGTHHHEFHFTVQEGLDALHDLIFHIESYEQASLAQVLAASACLHDQHVFQTLSLQHLALLCNHPQGLGTDVQHPVLSSASHTRAALRRVI